MQNFFTLLIKYSSLIIFLLLEGICFYLIVENNSSQREIFLNSSNVISGNVLQKYQSLVRLFKLSTIADSMQQEIVNLRNQLPSSQFTKVISDSTIDDTTHLQRYIYTPARIENNSVNQRNNYLTINKGQNDDMEVGMGLVSRDGVVGMVDRVGSHFSRAISILNPLMKVHASVLRTGYFGFVNWKGTDPTIITLEDVPKHADVVVGDTIVTSGYSTFPSGITIGKVKEILLDPGSNFFTIQVKLNIDISRIQYVHVIKDLFRQDKNSVEASDNLK